MKTYTVTVDDNGTNRWYINDQLHREDGPAFEGANGYNAWYLNGKRVTEQYVLNLSQTLEIEGVKYSVAQIKAALKKVA